MSTEPTQEQIEEISAILASGKKIEAIKCCREATGMGLKEAKEYVEALVPRLKEQDPERFAALSSQGAGCTSVILVCAGLTLGLGYVIQSLS